MSSHQLKVLHQITSIFKLESRHFYEAFSCKIRRTYVHAFKRVMMLAVMYAVPKLESTSTCQANSN